MTIITSHRRYVEAEEAEEEDILAISSYRQMLEVCKVFKKMLLAERAEARLARDDFNTRGSRAAAALSSSGNVDFGELDAKLAEDFGGSSAAVGEADSSKKLGFSVGTALPESKPAKGVEGISKFTSALHARHEAAASSSSPTRVTTFDSALDSKTRASVNDDDDASLNSNAMLETFVKSSEGAGTFDEFVSAKSQVKELKQKVKETSAVVNSSKSDIDRLQRDIDARKTSR
jgi:hypothetical protein